MAEKIISPGVFTRENDSSIVRKGNTAVGAALVGPTVKGTPLVPTYVTSYSEYESKFGSSFLSASNQYEYFTSLAAKEYFNSGGQSLLVTRIISGSDNVNVYATASVISQDGITESFLLEALTWGDIANNNGTILTQGALLKGTSNNVRWEVSDCDTVKGTFTLLVRRGDDNNNQKNIIETFSNLSLDPTLPNFISRVIGNQKEIYTVDTDGIAYVQYSGSYTNASNYIRVKSVDTLNINSLDNNGTFNSASYATTLPSIGSGSLGGAFVGGLAATNLACNFFEKIGNGNTSSNNIQGFLSNDYVNAFNLLINKAEYDFNLILAPGVTLDSNASANLISLCESRGDCIAIVDTKVFGSTITAAVSAAASSNSNYAATYFPWVQVFSNSLGKAVWVPASIVMGGVYAFNDEVSNEWFAPAGLNRGGIPSVLQAERKLTQSNKDTLYSANVNPLATFPGEGVVCWGQKTLQKRSTALDRVGVRRLLITLKRYIGQISRTLVFEQNTTATRNRFLSQVNPYLESIVQKQGLYAYRVVMDDTNNTADVIDRNQLVGQIQLQPTKTAEYIILDFNIDSTGSSFDS